MRDSDSIFRTLAGISSLICAIVLAGCGTDGPPSRAEKASKLMESADKTEKLEGIKMMGNAGKDGQNAIPEIMELLDSSDAEVRSAAVIALTSLRSKQALGKINEMVKSESDGPVLYQLLNGIKVLNGPEAMITACKSHLSGTVTAKREATSALAFLDPGAPIPVTELAALVQDEDADVRGNVATALGKVDASSGEAAAAVAALKMLAKDDDETVKANASGALELLGQ